MYPPAYKVQLQMIKKTSRVNWTRAVGNIKQDYLLCG